MNNLLETAMKELIGFSSIEEWEEFITSEWYEKLMQMNLVTFLANIAMMFEEYAERTNLDVVEMMTTLVDAGKDVNEKYGKYKEEREEK